MNKEVLILMAEDDEGHFLLTRKYLKARGVQNEIRWFAGGKETLDYFFDEHGVSRDLDVEELVLMLDLRMPGIDGMEVLEKIKSNPELTELPVIVLTASDNPVAIDEAYKLGAEAYIVKPVRYSSYIDAMRKVGLFPTVVENGVVLRKQKRTLSRHAGKS